MKKHIIGLALFSFIVSIAAVIYALFPVPEIAPVSEVIIVSAPQYTAKRSCRMKLKEDRVSSIEIRQAIFNVRTKQFDWELATPKIDDSIALHLFSKDGKGTRYITSERINNKFSHNGILRYSSSYDWLEKSASYENLYVIAHFVSEKENYKDDYQVYGINSEPKFDAAKATAVTIDYGE